MKKFLIVAAVLAAVLLAAVAAIVLPAEVVPAAFAGFTAVALPVLAVGFLRFSAHQRQGGLLWSLGQKLDAWLFDWMARTGMVLAMTTLAANKQRALELGERSMYPVIASDIIYEGAAVGLVAGTGHARPLVANDAFGGFAVYKADNSAGSAADINVETYFKGQIELAVSGAVITDVGQPVYASDDDTFTFNPADGTFVGFVKRFVSSGVAVVEFDALTFRDPWAHKTKRETLTGTKTFDAEDCGKLFCVTDAGDADALTLPAIADGLSGITILAVGAFGTTAVTISPAAADMILGPDITGADNKDLICTKATQRRGDFVTLIAGDADGYMVTEMRGTWAREA